MRLFAVAFTLVVLPLAARNPPAATPDPWKALAFIEGTWDAKAQGNGGASASGAYTFRRELGGHVLARHSTTGAGCQGPNSFDCDHGDLLYIYLDSPGQPLKAIYFDNEGHVIHYDVSTPTPNTLLFLSDPSRPGPQFRLLYEKKDFLMFGKFQMHMPGQTEWKSYLEWSGPKK